MKFPAEEVAAMNRRLAEKREKRKLDNDIKQVIAMVKRRPFPEPVPEVQGEPVEMVDDRGEAWRSVVLAVCFMVAALVRRMGTENWMFLLVLAVMAFLMAGIWR